MAKTKHQITIPPRLHGVRLDKAIADLLELPRNKISRLWSDGLITTADGRHLKPAQPAATGDHFVIDIPAAVPLVITPESLSRLDIIFEDDDILVVNKPAGLVAHPSSSTGDVPTLADLVQHARPAIAEARYSDADGDRRRAGLVHRLDKETSGVMVIAKTKAALETLKEAFKERRVQKVYQAVCAGDPGNQIVNAPIGRHPRRWWLRAVVETGKPAQTEFAVLKRGTLYRQPACLVQAAPRTGRTHQIRVHLLHLGCPILGDNRYQTAGSRELTRLANVPRLLLHAAELTLPHPRTGEMVTFKVAPPEDISTVAQAISTTA